VRDRARRAGRLTRPVPQSSLAHVAAVSFVAARAAPTAGFWITLAGGVALARAGERLGARRGFGASIAAMLQSVAILGPARLGVPLTQAVSAPIIGRLGARGAGLGWQLAACSTVRLLHNALATAFFIWVVVGGLDAYGGSYDALLESIGFLPDGPGAALGLTATGIVAWTAFASTVQVLIYRRGLRGWRSSERAPADPVGREALPADGDGRDASPADPSDRRAGATDPAAEAADGSGFDPRAVALAAAIAFTLLLVSTAAPVLAAVGLWLGLAWVVAGRLDRRVVPAGAVLAAILALSGFGFTLVGGLGLDLALRRGARAGLLVLVATWLRAAAGSAGLREVSRRGLARLRAIPSLPEASRALDELGSAPRLLAAGRSLFAALGPASKRPLPIVDAVLGWVRAESVRFRAAPPGAPPTVAARLRDGALVALAVAPLAALVPG
jgi:hypothetical protein